MQSVGDQVSTLVSSLERDHITALQHIDQLIGANASLIAERDALKSANAVLEKQLTENTVALLDTEEHLADAIKMVDAVGAAALDMLKVVKRPLGSPSPASSWNEPALGSSIVDIAGLPNNPIVLRAVAAPPIVPVLITDEMLKPDFAQQVAGDVMADDPPLQGDSGDETGEKPAVNSAAYLEAQKAITERLVEPVAPTALPVDLAPIREALEKNLNPTPATDDAMSRMGHGPSAMMLPPPVTMWGAEPVRQRLSVVHNDGTLPDFLQRDTVFQRGAIDSLL